MGRHISLIIPPERIAEEEQIIASLKAGQRIEHFETERLRADGRRVWVSLTISPVKDEQRQRRRRVEDGARHHATASEAEAERERFVTLVEKQHRLHRHLRSAGHSDLHQSRRPAMVGLDDIEEARAQEHCAISSSPRIDRESCDEFFPAVVENGPRRDRGPLPELQDRRARWMDYKVLTLTDGAGRPIAFATVSQDVTERKRLEDNLRKLAADLSEADRRKDEFLATLAHELRNPLAPLSNMLEVLKRTNDAGTCCRSALDTMERQLGQLVRLVDDLLDLNRITHNRLELRPSRVELHAVIQQAVEACRPARRCARARAARELAVGARSTCTPIRRRLAQVFGNLLNNACKYTERGGKIIADGASGKEARSSVAVKDTGIGIPPDKLDEHLRHVHRRSMRHWSSAQGGLGIGLTLVKRLVQMHGGSVEAKSAEGEGASSSFVCPCCSMEPSAARPEPVTALRPPATRRILIVDDNADSADSLAMLLRITGHETYTAHDGLGAIEAAEKHRPDVVLLDIGLPKLNGYDVCRRVREQPWGKNIVLIALTGWGQDEDRRKSHEAGFDGHLVKPVDHERLAALLRSLDVARRGYA